MSSDNTSEQRGEIVEATAVVEDVKVVRPEFIDPKKDTELRSGADKIVKSILDNPSDVTVTSSVYNLGKEAMECNTDQIKLMDTNISAVMGEITEESKVNKSLTQIKAELDLINPHVVASTKGRFGGFLASLIKRLPKSEDVMKIINERKDTVADTITALKEHLWSERDTALKNALQLSQISDKLYSTKEDLETAIYQGQLIWEKLSLSMEKEEDVVRKQSLTYLVNDLSSAVVDMQTVNQLNSQSRIGAENLVNNCRQIEKLVSRVTGILLPSVQNALMVKAAAMQQNQLLQAASDISKAASQTIEQTAKDVRMAATKAAKMNSKALVDIDALSRACDEYEAMQGELLVIFETSEKTAHGINNALSEMNNKMNTYADRLTKTRQARE